jgi:hypothetical protein
MSGLPTQFQIDYVEGALVALLKSVMPTAYGSAEAPVLVGIDTVNSKDFNAQGQLAMKPPSMRVQFGEASFSNLRDNQRLTYESAVDFDVLCFESSQRGKADERLQTLRLVDAALNQLAGARLALADGTSTMPLELKRVSLVIPDDGGPVDQLFAITVQVKGIAQFNGPNARFGS